MPIESESTDALRRISSTALVHDLIVVTRNQSDFEAAGLEVLNPFLL